MKELNVWETFPNRFASTNEIAEVIKAINDGIITQNLQIKERFTPGDEIDSIFENKASENNKILIYSDPEHQVMISQTSFIPSVISPSFYEKYKTEITTALKEKAISGKYAILSPIVFSEELLDQALSIPGISIEIRDLELTDEQIKKIKSKHVRAYLNNNDGRVQISSDKIVGTYTLEDLKDKTEITLNFDLSSEELENLSYVPDNCTISIFNINDGISSEKDNLEKVKKMVTRLEELNKPVILKFPLSSRGEFDKSDLKNMKLNTTTLVINNDLYSYSHKEYLEEDMKLDLLVKDIKESNMSPFEKYMAVYNIVKNFKPYKENEENKEESRYLRHILDNEYMVCVGYAKLFTVLLDKVGIKAIEQGVSVDTTMDSKDFQPSHAGHARVLVNLEDEKYGIKGYYISDPTWDNNLEKDYLNYAIIPFDMENIDGARFLLNDTDLFLNIHSFEEFVDKMNVLLRRTEKEDLRFNSKLKGADLTLKSYQSVYGKMKKTLLAIDYDNVSEIFKKCQKNSIESFEDFFTEIGYYLVTMCNKKVSGKQIIDATVETKRVLHKDSIKDLKKYEALLREENKSREYKVFPYKISGTFLIDTDENRFDYGEEPTPRTR